MKKVVLIGGSFNPITKAHIEMGKIAKTMYPYADVVYVPSNMDFIKKWKYTNGSEYFSKEKREELLKLALKDYDFQLDLRESNGELSGKTYDLVMDYKEKGYDMVHICVGFDKIDEIPKWYKAKELLSMVHPIVFSRGETSCPNVEVEKILLGNYILDKLETQCIFFKMEPEFSDMSSTKVREAFFKGNLKEVEYILPANVYNALNEEINKHR